MLRICEESVSMKCMRHPFGTMKCIHHRMHVNSLLLQSSLRQ